jgi:hypothetical protein
MPASVRGPSGYVAADARRGSISVGAREIRIPDVEAVEVTYTTGGSDDPSSHGVSLVLRDGGSLELARELESFGAARTVAVDFARECEAPIRDRTLGDLVERRWPEWDTPLAERHRAEPPPRPPAQPPGDDQTYDVSGMTMVFHSRPGGLGRIWRQARAGPKASVGQWIVGIIVLPLFLILVVPLIPFLALAYVVVRFRTGGKGPLLEVSAEGVRHKRLSDDWIPAGEIRDVEIAWKTAAAGREPQALVVRSDTTRIDYGASAASVAELEWLRDWVRALVCGG